MNSGKEVVTQHDLISIIEDFIVKSSGLSMTKGIEGEFSILQKNDAKEIRVRKATLLDVLVRKDAEGREFVQVNFADGNKILLTDQLVGFKPSVVPDLDISKLPKVVTTLDLLSVFEAIEESVSATKGGKNDDAETLKKVFNAILLGGELVGFDLTTERSWIKRLPVVTSKTAA